MGAKRLGVAKGKSAKLLAGKGLHLAYGTSALHTQDQASWLCHHSLAEQNQLLRSCESSWSSQKATKTALQITDLCLTLSASIRTLFTILLGMALPWRWHDRHCSRTPGSAGLLRTVEKEFTKSTPVLANELCLRFIRHEKPGCGEIPYQEQFGLAEFCGRARRAAADRKLSLLNPCALRDLTCRPGIVHRMVEATKALLRNYKQPELRSFVLLCFARR